MILLKCRARISCSPQLRLLPSDQRAAKTAIRPPRDLQHSVIATPRIYHYWHPCHCIHLPSEHACDQSHGEEANSPDSYCDVRIVYVDDIASNAIDGGVKTGEFLQVTYIVKCERLAQGTYE